ncbi:Ig-like domain-containing protein [Vibrio artabrorum]|nr:Ig-like domain-containing protein [Vibrio artabrorum]
MNRLTKFTLFFIAIFTIASGCKSEDIFEDNTAVTMIQVTPPITSLAKGNSTQLTATAFYADGRSRDVTETVKWQPADSNIATVTPQGLLIGADAGNTEVTASLGSVSSQDSGSKVDVAVSNAVLTEIHLTPPQVSIPKGTTKQLGAQGLYSDGHSHNLTQSVSWQSTDPNIARVTSHGLLIGADAGNTEVTASLGSVSSQDSGSKVDVAVSNAVLTEILLTPPLVSIPKETTMQISARGLYSDGYSHDLTQSVSWQSADPNIATVTPQGLLTGADGGNTEVTASLGSVSSRDSGSKVDVAISNAVLTEIHLTPPLVSLPKETTKQLSAQGLYSDGHSYDLTQSVSWQPAAPNIATVTPQGLLTGVVAGNTEVTASLGRVSSRDSSSKVNVAISNAVLTEIHLTPAQVSIPKETTKQLRAQGVYSDGSSHDLTQSVSWQSADPNIATVTPQGLLTGVDGGNTEVTASLGNVSSQDSGSTVDVAISNAVLTEIHLTPAQVSIPKGTTMQLTAQGLYSDGHSYDLTQLVSWQPADPNIATVTSQGLLIGVDAGNTEVIASLGSVTSRDSGSTVDVAISNAVLTEIHLTPASTSLIVGSTSQLIAMGTYSDKSQKNITSEVLWQSAQPRIATVTQGGGLVTGVADGTATISAIKGTVVSSNTAGISVQNATITKLSLEIGPNNTLRNFAIGFVGDMSPEFRVMAELSNGNKINVTSSAVISLLNCPNCGSVNKVSDYFKINFLAQGVVNVHAIYHGKYATSNNITVINRIDKLTRENVESTIDLLVQSGNPRGFIFFNEKDLDIGGEVYHRVISLSLTSVLQHDGGNNSATYYDVIMSQTVAGITTLSRAGIYEQLSGDSFDYVRPFRPNYAWFGTLRSIPSPTPESIVLAQNLDKIWGEKVGNDYFKAPDSTTRNWSDANLYCQNRKWELPDKNELIQALRGWNSADIDGKHYWTSTPDITNLGSTDYYAIDDLSTSWTASSKNESKLFSVICVRKNI